MKFLFTKNVFLVKLDKAFFKKKVVKDFIAMFSTDIALQPISVLKEFVVAKYLGPSDYGILKSLELIRMLNKYGSTGFNSTALREVGDTIGQEDIKKANLIRNTSYSSEFIFSTILFIIALLSSLFFDSIVLSVLIILASIGLYAQKVRMIFNTEATIQKEYVLTSKINFVTTLIASIIVIITVPFFKIFAVISLATITSILAIIAYYKYLHFDYRFEINKKEFVRLLKISIPMMLGTFAQGSFQYAERLIILGYLGKVALGFYGFGFMIANQFINLLKVAISVRMQDIFEAVGKKEFVKVHRIVFKETMILVIAAIILIPIIWTAVDIFIPLLLPKWIEGIPIAKTLFLVVPVSIIHNYANAVVISSLVDRIKSVVVMQCIATLILLSSTYTLNYLGKLDLTNLIYVVIFSYMFYHGSVLVLYKVFFYNIYIKGSSI